MLVYYFMAKPEEVILNDRLLILLFSAENGAFGVNNK